MTKRIPIVDAKKELIRIDRCLKHPHLLIGGLAVNQYYPLRNSYDIDLIIEYEVALQIIDKLYPSLNWKIEDKNQDEFRPSYRISNRQDDNFIIYFGPKIIQRKSYDYINWDLLKISSVPIIIDNKPLKNILIPSATNLSFTKLISFFNRRGTNKGLQDLKDFVDLTNNEKWNPVDFYILIKKVGAVEYIVSNSSFNKDEFGHLSNSSVFQLTYILNGQKIENVTSSKPRYNEDDFDELISSLAAKVYHNKKSNKTQFVYAFDIQGFRAINMKYGSPIADNIIGCISTIVDNHKFPGIFDYIKIGDTFVIFIQSIGNGPFLNNLEVLISKILNYNWETIHKSLYLNIYAAFDIRGVNENLNIFVLRILNALKEGKKMGQQLINAKDTKINYTDIDDLIS